MSDPWKMDLDKKGVLLQVRTRVAMMTSEQKIIMIDPGEVVMYLGCLYRKTWSIQLPESSSSSKWDQMTDDVFKACFFNKRHLCHLKFLRTDQIVEAMFGEMGSAFPEGHSLFLAVSWVYRNLNPVTRKTK